MISQNKAERPLNITSILNNFKSFIKQVYQNELGQIINKKKQQNNYFRAGINQKVEKVLKIKENKAACLLIIEKFYFFSEIQFF